MIFETHCHLNDSQFEEDIKDVILRAKENNVLSLCIIGWDKKSSLEAIKISKMYSNMGVELYPVCGLHPENVNEEDDKDLNWLIELIESNKTIAIGEIGIDLHWVQDNLDLQKYYFKKQLELAEKYDLPVIIHSRDAMQITTDIIKEYKNVKGIFHAFSGSVEMAKIITKCGYKLGIGGVVTYKNSHLPEVVEALDLSNFVCETDSPYLPPVPFRGKRNEPSYLIYVINKIMEVKNMDKEEVENTLYNNSLEILRVK